jgi:branched-subunit amino acid aminotransferase/4-amino-4-deoxychorismate lyase
MIGTAIIVNGRLAPPDAAVFNLDDTDAAYGYGCYETLKVRESRLYFADFHEERLLGSAEILGIAHDLQPGAVAAALDLLVRENGLPECNVKVMLIGHQGRPADWYAFLLPPVIPPAAVYRQGADCLLFAGERHFPQAKSLSMLLSTVAYRLATSLACYDALLVNRRGQLTEGTRTNLFYLRPGEGDVVFTPPAADVLEGITRRTLIAALAEAGVRTEERPLPLDEALGGAFSLMVTSTSSRVIPVRSLRGPAESAAPASVAGPIALVLAPELERVAAVYDAYLQG